MKVWDLPLSLASIDEVEEVSSFSGPVVNEINEEWLSKGAFTIFMGAATSMIFAFDDDGL